MSVVYDDKTIKIIKSVFPKSVIEDQIIKIFKNKSSIESFFGLFKKKSINLDKDKSCFDFVIESDHIYIKNLKKCGIIKGSYFLDNISILVTKLRKIEKKIKYIKLIDISEKYICNIPICLITIKILTTGESWYNKHGYYSKNYEKEKKLNKEIIEKKYSDFVNDIKKLSVIDEIIDNNVFDNIDVNITVQNYFNRIWTQIINNSKKENCENEKFINQLKWLKKFINIIKKSKILIYNFHLIKIFEPKDEYTATKYLKKGYYKKYKKYKNKYLNLKNQLG